MLLAVGRKHATEHDLLRLASTWGVIQTYYVVYHATQAAAIGRGFRRPDSHPKTHNQFLDFWVQRDFDVSPWSLGHGAGGSINIPAGAEEREVHNWSTCNAETAPSLAAKALRTTRDEKIREAERKARATKAARMGRELRQVRLSRDDKDAIRRRIKPAALIHYLYRLRIRMNYEDPDLFVRGPESDEEARVVFYDLRFIAAATLLFVERELASVLGAGSMRRMMDDWLRSASLADGRLGVALRRDFFA